MKELVVLFEDPCLCLSGIILAICVGIPLMRMLLVNLLIFDLQEILEYCVCPKLILSSGFNQVTFVRAVAGETHTR